MSASMIQHTPSAYQYPLLIKHLLHTPLAHAADQEIVYRDLQRFEYRTLVQRISRLAAGLAGLGVKPGNTVAMMDWDSHRYLECFFGVPMMGAVLHTVNIRLSPEQILYTINHARRDPASADCRHAVAAGRERRGARGTRSLNEQAQLVGCVLELLSELGRRDADQ